MFNNVKDCSNKSFADENSISEIPILIPWERYARCIAASWLPDGIAVSLQQANIVSSGYSRWKQIGRIAEKFETFLQMLLSKYNIEILVQN